MEPAPFLSDSIRCSTALALVHRVRRDTSVPATYISGLDALLDAAGLSLRRGDVVEVQGLPGSAKTSLLLHLAATAVLPRTAHVRIANQVLSVPVGGKEQHIAWFDCTAARFDVDRLASLVRHHLDLAIRRFRAPRGIGAPRDTELDSLVDECMARLTVWTPTSTLQLAATLQGLPRWALDHAAEELGYVLIDGMSEFAWADQYAAAAATASVPLKPAPPAVAGPSLPPPPPPSPRPLRLVLDALANVRTQLSPLVFITQWVFRPHAILARKSQEGLPFYAPHFPPSTWPSILTPAAAGSSSSSSSSSSSVSLPVSLALHLTLHPAPTAPLRRGTPLALLLSEQRRRLRVRERALAAQSASLGTATGGVGGTEGIRCVVRRPGGAEVGSWKMEVWDKEIVT